MMEYEFPGRIYVRPQSLDEHRVMVEDWNRELEERRKSFVYPKRDIRILATLILILGLLTLILQITISTVRAFGFIRLFTFFPTFIGTGVWTGIFSIIAGIMGLAAAQRSSISITLDFSIVSTIVNFLSTILIIFNSVNIEMNPTNSVTRGLQSSLIFLGLLLFMTTGMASLYTCRIMDSRSKINTPPLVVYYQTDKTTENHPEASNGDDRVVIKVPADSYQVYT